MLPGKIWSIIDAKNSALAQEERKMNKPVLVVMAAGMGSRYGGMKQIDPVGPNGQVKIGRAHV